MPGSPDRGLYSPRENYDRAYETSENTRSALSSGSQPQVQQPESPLSLFAEPTSHNDSVRSSRHYSVDYSSSHADWFPGNTAPPDSYYEGSFQGPHRYPHEGRSNSLDLGTQNIPPRPLGDGIQPPFSDVFSQLNRSLVVEPGQQSTSGEATYFAPNDVPDSVYLPPGTLDPRLNPQPPKPFRRALRNYKTKLNSKAVRRNSAQQLPQQPSQQGAFNSAPDHGNIPGCHVLTPVEISQAGDSLGVSSPQEAPKKEKSKRKPMPEEERAAVKQNRLHGVCYRCKIFKERVMERLFELLCISYLHVFK